MKKIYTIFAAILLTALSALAGPKTIPDGPFGWAVCASASSAGGFDMNGGGQGRTVVLRNDGTDMRAAIIKALKDYDVVVLDGSRGDFVISSFMQIAGASNKTIMGINGAVLRTSFEVTPELKALLDSVGVKKMSDQGGGGPLSNGAFVAEEREQHTRQAIIDHTGDKGETYRRAGILGLSACENVVLRNIAFIGPGPIDVGGYDLLTVSRGSEHIWVDHCSFTDGLDGNFDINSGSDFITVSWSTFQYTDKAYDHKASNLIGSSERPSEGEGKFHITFAYCIWGEGCEVRMPVVRFGTIHLLNDYYDCAGNYAPAVNACIGSKFLMEGNYFEKGVKNIYEATPDAEGTEFKGNIFLEKFKVPSGIQVPMPYAYTAIAASQVPKIVGKQSGPTMALTAPVSSVQFTIHLMGDSTMADKDISGGNPERGWGMVFENFVDEDVRVINYAKNGRSTKSFIDEGLWDKVKANTRPGDYIFIQFSHNDEKSGKPKVYAAAWGAYQDNLRRFIREARELGATPVLLTPVARRRFVDGKLDETTHGDYPAAMKAVATETGVTLIDMQQATFDWINAAGDQASRPYFMWVEAGTCPAIPAGRQDDTHSTARGARKNCDIVCDSIRVKLPEIAKHLVRYDAVVDKDGRGDFLTVQAAIDAMPDYMYRRVKTILVKPGTYRERVIIPPSKTALKIVGKDASNTVIVYGNYARKLYPDSTEEIGTTGTATMFIEASFVTLENLSIVNDSRTNAVPDESRQYNTGTDSIGQAVSLFTDGDCIFLHRCRIKGDQDTIYTYGRYGAYGSVCRSYYLDCQIEGTTDFIFGPGIVYFEGCEILSKKNSYVTAASTFKGQDYGYVFHKCKLTAAPGIDLVYLGRPWREYAKVVFVECELGPHIRPEGWHNWGSTEKEKTAYYAEYHNVGPGADTSARVGWSHQLTVEEASAYTFDKVMGLAGYEHPWNPFNNKTPDR